MRNPEIRSLPSRSVLGVDPSHAGHRSVSVCQRHGCVECPECGGVISLPESCPAEISARRPDGSYDYLLHRCTHAVGVGEHHGLPASPSAIHITH